MDDIVAIIEHEAVKRKAETVRVSPDVYNAIRDRFGDHSVTLVSEWAPILRVFVDYSIPTTLTWEFKD